MTELDRDFQKLVLEGLKLISEELTQMRSEISRTEAKLDRVVQAVASIHKDLSQNDTEVRQELAAIKQRLELDHD